MTATAYYQVRTSREAWVVSVGIHLWLLALLLFLPIAAKPIPSPSQPLELTMIDLGGPPGDRATGRDRPAPKPLSATHARPVYQPLPQPEERHRAVQRSPIVRARPPARPEIPTIAQPDPLALAAEERRRRLEEQQQLAEADTDTGAPDSTGVGSRSNSRPAAGGAVSVGRGAMGDLAGRGIESMPAADFPATAASRHRLGWQGMVVATIQVAPDGQIASVSIVRSSGDPDVDSAAMAAFRHWRFSPLPAGQPPAIQVGQVKMRFVLR
ncbi:MAG: TonB family protein [Cyanobacteria bacterium REEB65]|nr:TonB family protein [Cyanobacteria bacterium REEB65]